MKRLILLDGHAILFRAYHSMPPFTTPDGRPSGAVAGFTNVLVRVLRELEPAWVIGTFDSPGPTFREEKFAAYKGTRSETPPDIITQEPMVKEVLTAFGIPSFAVKTFEADDIIATLTRQALATEVEEVVVVTGDRDLLQLSQDRVKIYLLRNGDKEITLLDEPAVMELIGVPPPELLEWKALRGDPSDNIPGVKGIGDKTAVALIKQYKSLEGLYEALENDSEAVGVTARVRQLLLDGKDTAFLSRELLTVRYDAPVELDLAAASLTNYRKKQASELLTSFGFKTVLGRLPEDNYQAQARLF